MPTDYEILKNILMPEVQSGRRPGFVSYDKYPFASMDIDDCFFVKNGVYASISVAKREAQKRLGRTFAIRGVGTVGAKTIGVWRTA